jgi:GTPase
VLREIGAGDKATLLAMNKSDLMTEVEIDKLRGRYPDAVFCSAQTGPGMDDLLDAIVAQLSRLKVEVRLEIPFDRGDVVARVHEEGDVLEETYSEKGTRLLARLDRSLLPEMTAFLVEQSART